MNKLNQFLFFVCTLSLISCQEKELTKNLETPKTQDEIENDMLAAASISKGREQFRKCAICHKLDIKESTKSGPDLWGVYGRKIAALDDFKYSHNLKEFSSEVWNYKNLDKWIKKPHSFAPKTLMLFEGLSDPQDRMDLIAYLRTLKLSEKFKDQENKIKEEEKN